MIMKCHEKQHKSYKYSVGSLAYISSTVPDVGSTSDPPDIQQCWYKYENMTQSYKNYPMV